MCSFQQLRYVDYEINYRVDQKELAINSSGSSSISNRVVPKPSQAIDPYKWWCQNGSVSMVLVVPFEKSSGARAPLAPPLTEPLRLMDLFTSEIWTDLKMK